MTLHLASTSPLKLEVLKEVYKGEIVTHEVETPFPQPIGEKTKKECLWNRLYNVKNPDADIIAIESYISVKDGNFYESCEVWLSEKGNIRVGKSLNDVMLDPILFEEYMDCNPMPETYGMFLQLRGLCSDHKNWTKDVVGVDRKEIIRSALKDLF